MDKPAETPAVREAMTDDRKPAETPEMREQLLARLSPKDRKMVERFLAASPTMTAAEAILRFTISGTL
jgi:hypothetical protein